MQLHVCILIARTIQADISERAILAVKLSLHGLCLIFGVWSFGRLVVWYLGFGFWTGVDGGVGYALDEHMVAWFALSFAAILGIGLQRGANLNFQVTKILSIFDKHGM